MNIQKFEHATAWCLQRSLYEGIAIGTSDFHEKREKERESDTEEKRGRYIYISKVYFASLVLCVRNSLFS